MMRIAGIDHLVLRSPRAEELVRFYSEVLGCVEERRLADDIGLIQLRAGSSLIDIVPIDSELGRRGGDAPNPDAPNMDHFCLLVEDIDEQQLSALLARHGVEAPDFQRRYGATGYGRSVYIRDPDGNTVELKLQKD